MEGADASPEEKVKPILDALADLKEDISAEEAISAAKLVTASAFLVLQMLGCIAP